MKTIFLIIILVFGDINGVFIDQLTLDIFDLTKPTTWDDMTEYYVKISREKQWRICHKCGFPKMGTTIHYQYYGANSQKPAAISVEFLLTRLVVIDVSSLVKNNSNLALTLEDVYSLIPLERDAYRPTLLLFNFGWTEHPSYNEETRCLCLIPGISYDLAAFIAVNLGHVVGVGTDTPSLESEETRQMPLKTVSGRLGKSGIYIIENVDMKRKIPEKGCLAMVLPLKLLNQNYVPARLTAICPPLQRDSMEVILAQRDTRKPLI